MKKDIKDYVAAYSTCQQNKYDVLSPAVLLQPLNVPFAIWDDIYMDFIEGLPRSQGFDSIMVVRDRLRKYGNFIPLRHPFSTKQAEKEFIKMIV